MARDPGSCHQLSAELPNDAAISRFVSEAPADIQQRLSQAALDIVLRGTPAEVANIRLVPFEHFDGAIDALAPLVHQEDPRLQPLGGGARVALRLANASRTSPRVHALLDHLVRHGARSPALTEAVAKSVPALLAQSPSSFEWPASPADTYVILASLPATERATVVRAVPDLVPVVDFARRVGDPQGLLPLLRSV